MHDLDRTLQTLEPEAEYGAGEYELSPEIFGSPSNGRGATPLSAEAEMALAGELLTVTNEAELEQFMENFEAEVPYPRCGGRGHRRRRHLRRHFKRFATQPGRFYGYRGRGVVPPALPVPAVVDAADADADTADDPDGGEELELELDGARRCVRLGAALAKKAAEIPAAGPAGGDPEAHHAHRQTGRWVRRGRKLILLGV